MPLSELASLLERYNRLSRLTRCRELLTKFIAQGLDSKVREQQVERFRLAKWCVDRIRETRRYKCLQWPDIFALLRSDLSENSLSDITAAVLDPRRTPWKKAIVSSLLNRYFPALARLFDKAEIHQIYTKREVAGSSSRVDLRIWTKENLVGDIVIDFEFKIGEGAETLHPETGKPQTKREWADLLHFADAQRIGRNNVAAFFVTSSGKPAAIKGFKPLARRELHDLIIITLDSFSRKERDRDGQAAIDALRWFFTSPYVV